MNWLLGMVNWTGAGVNWKSRFSLKAVFPATRKMAVERSAMRFYLYPMVFMPLLPLDPLIRISSLYLKGQILKDTILYQKICMVPHCTMAIKLLFLELFTSVQFAKGQVLVAPGQSFQSIYFIEEGIARGYQQVEDWHATHWLAGDGTFIMPDGYFTKLYSSIYIDFLTCTGGFVLDHRAAKRFFKSNPQAILLLLWMQDEKHAIARQREEMLRITDLGQRYRFLYRSNPFIINHAPRETIASYLNISVRHYDRIRKLHINER